MNTNNLKNTIRAEIERRFANTRDYRCEDWIDEREFQHGRYDAYKGLLSFLDYLPEQPVEDLNELIRKWDRVNINTIQKAKVKATGEIIDGFYDGRGHFDHFVDHDVFDRYSIEDVEPIIDEPYTKSNSLFDKCVENCDPAVMKEVSDNVDKMLLEEEYKDYVENDPVYSKLVNRNAGLGIARHFAEWGAEHLKR